MSKEAAAQTPTSTDASIKPEGDMETVETPDVSKPANVSEETSDRFGDEVDWSGLASKADEPAHAPLEDESAVDAGKDEKPSEEEAPAESDEVADAVAPTPDEASVEKEEEFQPSLEEEVPDLPEVSEEEWQKQYTEGRDAAIEELSERYQFTQEEADLLMTKPEEVLPKMVARAYVDVFESVIGAIRQMLPGQVTQINQEYTANQERTQAFFGAFPALATEEGQAEVVKIGKMYRELNPDASQDDFIKHVGVQASLSLGLPIPGVEQPSEPQDDEPVPAFTPASSGGVTEVPTDPRQSSNQFERLNAEWDDE